MWILLIPVGLCFMWFDMWYFLRFFIVNSFYSLNRTKSLLEESVVYGICLTTDIDFMIHMNNSRYLRECDFGRFKLWIQNGTWHLLRSFGGNMFNTGNNIRYRKSLNLFDIFKIKTRVIYWDDRAFYVEQQMIRTKDNFVCAVNTVKQTLTNVSPTTIAEKLGVQAQPQLTEEVECLLKSWQLSSERLRQ